MMKQPGMIQKIGLIVAATAWTLAAQAQIVPAVKETGKAISESSQEAGDNLKAVLSKEPGRSVNKAKARIHKAKAHVHRHNAKKAAGAALH